MVIANAEIIAAFDRHGLELSDTALITPCGEGSALTFTVSGHLLEGGWFYGNIDLFDGDINESSEWSYAIGECCGDYGELYVFDAYTNTYKPAAGSDEYDEIATMLDALREDFDGLDLAA